MAGPAIFGLMIWLLYLRFIVPVLGVFYGTSLIADEVEDKTITYLFTRPIPRGAVLLGKYLAYLACTVLRRPAVGDARLLADRADARAASARSFLDLLKDLALLALGLAVYGAVFAFVGARFKRPLLVGLDLRVRLGAGGAGVSRATSSSSRSPTTCRRWSRTRCRTTASSA